MWASAPPAARGGTACCISGLHNTYSAKLAVYEHVSEQTANVGSLWTRCGCDSFFIILVVLVGVVVGGGCGIVRQPNAR